jgi:hypothetical protein
MTEIDNEHFCSANKAAFGCVSPCCKEQCKCYHRKWPTPSQFEKEYGTLDVEKTNYPIWILREEKCPDYPEGEKLIKRWVLSDVYVALFDHRNDDKWNNGEIVFACTPYGKPPAAWRPEAAQ